MTTAPASKRVRNGTPTELDESVTSNTFGAAGAYSGLKPNFFNLDLPPSDLGPAPAQTSIFHQKRHTAQPATYQLGGKIGEVNRGIIDASDPLRMNSYTRKALKKAGCAKEQERQYLSHVSEATRTNSQLRQKIQSQQASLVRKNQETTPKALIAILPVPEIGIPSRQAGSGTAM